MSQQTSCPAALATRLVVAKVGDIDGAARVERVDRDVQQRCEVVGKHYGATRVFDRRTVERAARRPVDVPEVLRSPTDNGDQRPTATDDGAETIALSVPPSARGDGSSGLGRDGGSVGR